MNGDNTPIVSMDQFFESVPPGTKAVIKDLNRQFPPLHAPEYQLHRPVLRLHCPSEDCKGERLFTPVGRGIAGILRKTDVFVNYLCKNCEQSFKTYAVRFQPRVQGSGVDGVGVKFGEMPPFGPPIPTGFCRLVGQDRELFLRGRRAQHQGLGLGALVYYRRVVEHQWKRMIGEILRVAEGLDLPTEQIEALQAAQSKKEFSRAVRLAKDAIPQSLLINGHHNPLNLLHSTMSENIHEGSEERCLELAEGIRAVFFDLSARVNLAVQDRTELRKSLSQLLTAPEP